MKTTMKLLLVALALTVNGTVSAQPLNVLATVPDLAEVARSIGGDQVTVTSLTEGTEDIHLVPIRPSMFAKARAADLFLEVGRGHRKICCHLHSKLPYVCPSRFVSPRLEFRDVIA